MFKKNTSITGFGIGHFINASTGAAVTTGTPTCKRTIDGTGGACANAAAYNADGAVWEIDLADTDMNGSVIILSFTLTDCIPISYTIKTAQVDADDAVHFGLSAMPNAVPGTNGGLPTTNGTVVNQTVGLTAGQSIACSDKTGFALTAAYDPAKTALQPGGTLATVTTLTNLPAIPADWLTAEGVKADAVTKIQNGLATPTNITAGTITTVTTLTNMPVSNLLLSTSVASISVDEVEITLVAGSTVDDAYNGQTVVLYDVNNSNYPSIRKIIDYVGATKTITIDTGADFTVVAGDTVRIFIDGNGTDIDLISTIVGANGGKIDEVVASIAEVDAAIQTITVSLSAEELASLISGLTAGIIAAPEISRLLAGTGSVTWPYYVLGPGSVPIPNARVFVYSNSGLTTLVAKGTTNDFGLITFYLDPGTYYFVVRATGFTFDPDTEVVS